MYHKLRQHLQGNRLHVGIIMIVFSLIFDHSFLVYLWVIAVGNKLLFSLLNIAVHINALLFFLGYLAIITALTKKRTTKWYLIFTIFYFVLGLILLVYLLYLPADTQLLASQIFRWPLITSYLLF